MFYDRYNALCEQRGKKPYEVARELGCSNSNVAQWKKGSVPRKPMLEKIAEYFGVSSSYLIYGDQIKSPATQEGSGEDDMDIRLIISKMTDDELIAVLSEASNELKRRNDTGA